MSRGMMDKYSYRCLREDGCRYLKEGIMGKGQYKRGKIVPKTVSELEDWLDRSLFREGEILDVLDQARKETQTEYGALLLTHIVINKRLTEDLLTAIKSGPSHASESSEKTESVQDSNDS